MTETQTTAATRRPKSRPKRWAAAALDLQRALEAIDAALERAEAAAADLREVQEEYEEWMNNMPEGLRSSPLGEKLDAVCELQIEEMIQPVRDAVEEAQGVAEEAEAIDLPRGFGKD